MDQKVIKKEPKEKQTNRTIYAIVFVVVAVGLGVAFSLWYIRRDARNTFDTFEYPTHPAHPVAQPKGPPITP